MDPASTEIPLTEPIPDPGQKLESKSKKTLPVLLIIAVILVVALLITGAVFLLRSSGDTTARVRDVFIIIMALESLVIGIALVVLIIQLAVLINLLNNEVRPIIKSTNDTVNTLKGTVHFLGDNLTEPVIKLNETLAGFRKFIDIIRPGKRFGGW